MSFYYVWGTVFISLFPMGSFVIFGGLSYTSTSFYCGICHSVFSFGPQCLASFYRGQKERTVLSLPLSGRIWMHDSVLSLWCFCKELEYRVNNTELKDDSCSFKAVMVLVTCWDWKCTAKMIEAFCSDYSHGKRVAMFSILTC